MKALVLVLSFLASLNAFSKNIELRVERIICGEIDPYILGDACVLYGANEKSVYGLVLEIDEYLNFLENEVSEGDLISLDDTFFGEVQERQLSNLINSIARDLNSQVEVYEVSSLKLAFNHIKKSITKNSFRLTCKEAYPSQDGMFTHIDIESLIHIKSFDTYELYSPRLSYKLYPIDDPSILFSDFDNQADDYSRFNKRNFSPIRYDGFMKFSDLYGNKTKGKINLLLPIDKIDTRSRRKRFHAYLQMADMYGRFGTTVKLVCNILRTTNY